MLDPKNREGLSKGDAKFLEIIDKYGWHVMNVAPRVDSDDGQEWFSYTTGLFAAFKQPEIIMFGLHDKTATLIINEIGNFMKGGRRFELGLDYTDVFANDLKCTFRAVHPSHYQEYLGWSQWFYEDDNFPTWQCFWPDKKGNYPWEESCSQGTIELQPLLFNPAL